MCFSTAFQKLVGVQAVGHPKAPCIPANTFMRSIPLIFGIYSGVHLKKLAARGEACRVLAVAERATASPASSSGSWRSRSRFGKIFKGPVDSHSLSAPLSRPQIEIIGNEILLIDVYVYACFYPRIGIIEQECLFSCPTPPALAPTTRHVSSRLP